MSLGACLGPMQEMGMNFKHQGTVDCRQNIEMSGFKTSKYKILLTIHVMPRVLVLNGCRRCRVDSWLTLTEREACERRPVRRLTERHASCPRMRRLTGKCELYAAQAH